MPPELTFRSFFFGTGLGYALYYMLRNDWVWSLLSDQEKDFVKAQNEYWNNNAPGYANPSEYQGQKGKSFNTIDNRLSTWEGRAIDQFLNVRQPTSVMEVGPGSGYYTRLIIDCPSVVSYTATDINKNFLNAIDKEIDLHPRGSSIKKQFYAIAELEKYDVKVDAIVILSALHHIPDREDFLNKMSLRLNPGGVVFFYEPTHSLIRILELFFSFIRQGWFLTHVIKKRNNFMTHHFCTIKETENIAGDIGLKFVNWNWNSYLPLPRWRVGFSLLSREMVAVLQKN